MIENATKVRILPAASLPKYIERGMVAGKFTTDLPVMGAVYAVDVGQIISEDYPYKVVGVAEIHLEEIK